MRDYDPVRWRRRLASRPPSSHRSSQRPLPDALHDGGRAAKQDVDERNGDKHDRRHDRAGRGWLIVFETGGDAVGRTKCFACHYHVDDENSQRHDDEEQDERNVFEDVKVRKRVLDDVSDGWNRDWDEQRESSHLLRPVDCAVPSRLFTCTNTWTGGRWLQLRFDFDSTPVRLLIKGR